MKGMMPTTLRRRVATLLVSLLVLQGTVVAQPTDEAEESAPPAEESQPVKTIKMTAENWKWTPKVIRVAQGTRLRLEFQSWDASHSFVLKAYGIKVPLPQDSTAKVEFVAARKGEFKWRCGRPCGDGCAKMVGKLIVE
jgi:heme/copper-type cytochrome/quinol oxidase subunit 2